MVDTIPNRLEWEVHNNTEPRFSDYHRLLSERVGGRVSGCNNSRALVPTGSTKTHQCAGINSYSLCSERLCGEKGGLPRSYSVWNFCISKRIIITVEYLPGLQNVVADRESRIYKDTSNWKLLPSLFKQL